MDLANVAAAVASAPPPCMPNGIPAGQQAGADDGAQFQELLAQFAAFGPAEAEAPPAPSVKKTPADADDGAPAADTGDEPPSGVALWMLTVLGIDPAVPAAASAHSAGAATDGPAAGEPPPTGVPAAAGDSAPGVAEDLPQGCAPRESSEPGSTPRAAEPFRIAVETPPLPDARTGAASGDDAGADAGADVGADAGTGARSPGSAPETPESDAQAAQAAAATGGGRSSGAPAGRVTSSAARALARAVQSSSPEPSARPTPAAVAVEEPATEAAAPPVVPDTAGTAPADVWVGTQSGERAPKDLPRAANAPNAAAGPVSPDAGGLTMGRAETHAGAGDDAADRDAGNTPFREPASAPFRAAVETRLVVEAMGARASEAAPVAPTVDPATASGPIPEPALQIVRAMRVQAGNGISEAVIRLRPEHLGEVRISLTVERGGVTAVLHAERADVRAHILAHADSLKESLASLGLRLDNLVVREDGRKSDDGQQAREQHAGEQAPRRYRRPPAHAFELAPEA